jgi:RNA polymerase sigma factor (sigma-70 family)
MASEEHDDPIQVQSDALWRQGDRNAATTLVVEHWAEALKRYALRRGLAPPDAEEVVFTSLFQVLQRHGGGHYQQLKPVLYRTVKNLAFNRKRDGLRHRTAKLEDSAGELADPVDSLEADWVSLEERGRLRRAVDRLGDPFRRIIELRYYADPPLPINEIATVLGMKKRTVEKKLQMSHELLQRALVREDEAA